MVGVLGASLVFVALGLVAQFWKGPTPAPTWARFVDGSMAWAITPERVGPARYVRFSITPAGEPGAVRYAMIENGGAHQWKTEGRFAASMGHRRVTMFVERSQGRAIVATAPAWVLWAPGIALGTLPALGWVVRKRASRRGLCVACGYDLRGTAQDMPCPECGSARSDSAAAIN